MTASNLVVPIVMWGRTAPTHCVASILMTPDMKKVITGCNDGQICIWDILDNWQVHPQNMLFGHSTAVTALAMGSSQPDNSHLISSSDNGEMCLWDLQDGRCIENVKTSNVHTAIQSYQLLQSRDVRLICNGYYPDILIVHPWSLEVLFTLTSRIQPDWISALCILRPVKREDDVVLAITNSGTVKMWTLGSVESKGSQPIVEDESKQIRCLNAQTLKCCPYNQRTILIVCSKYWQIYDAGDFALLCSESSRRGERWSGGDFIGVDRVVVWSNEGRGYLYKLPTNANPDSEGFHKSSNPANPSQHGPQSYTILDVYTEKSLECAPAMLYFFGRRDRESRLLLRGDSEGRLVVWTIPDVHDNKMKLRRQDSFEMLPVVQPKVRTSLQDEWVSTEPMPEGLIDQINCREDRHLEITSSIFCPGQGKVVFGCDDGSIVIVPAAHAIILQLLDNGQSKDHLPHQILEGHSGRVNCLLYPANASSRYESHHLLSGGVDFTVCLWDIRDGSKLHSFCLHGGEILQLLVPPDTCNARVLPCVCSVAADHSLALLSLKERKCIMLAARQLFPIQTVKWRPFDDFLVIGTTDGTVYVWQMETGHLDRVVHGMTAEDILNACDEKLDIPESNLTNPTISLAQAFKRHNIATFRNLASQQFKKAQGNAQNQQGKSTHPSLIHRPPTSPLMVQGLRTNTKDPDSHIVFFDTEALIVQLLGEEYSNLSPSSLEAIGFLPPSNDPQVQMSEAQKKVVDFLSKVKDKAENVGQKIQARAESAGIRQVSPNVQRKADGQWQGSPSSKPSVPKLPLGEKYNSVVMTTAQLFMSCLHAWGLDLDLDRVCMSKLGMIAPKRPINFGVISRGGHMSLSLPGWFKRLNPGQQPTVMATNGHWKISRAVTTQHLSSVISVANTLMSMTHASFVPSLGFGANSEDTEPDGAEQAQTKQGWSLLAALHCVLLPELIGTNLFQPPLLDMLARRWQDRCLEIREAAQALLLAELRRIGHEGRKKIVEEWALYLPSYVDPELSLLAEQQQSAQASQGANTIPLSSAVFSEEEEEDEDGILGEGDTSGKQPSGTFESRRRQATAIVMMGVIGAEFGATMGNKTKEQETDDSSKKNVAEGFGLVNYAHARHTSKALMFLLLHPPTPRLPAYTPIRRAAVDLLGRGFTVWEPYLDVSAVLLGLLEHCVDGDKLVPSMTFGLPLSPRADACRTARHALSLIATARPPAFIITMAKEVARYNAMAQNAQSQHHAQHQLHNSVLVRAKSELLRVIELLVDKIPNEVADLLVEVMDVTVHCLDGNAIKAKGLPELFPSLCRFVMVSYCSSTRRIAVGSKNGAVALYELKQSKCTVMPAHKGAVAAVAFSPDGKFLASYSYIDNRLLFWQTATSSLFNLGSQSTKTIKSCSAPPLNIPPNSNPLKVVKLVWVDNRTVVILSADGTENRFRV